MVISVVITLKLTAWEIWASNGWVALCWGGVCANWNVSIGFIPGCAAEYILCWTMVLSGRGKRSHFIILGPYSAAHSPQWVIAEMSGRAGNPSCREQLAPVQLWNIPSVAWIPLPPTLPPHTPQFHSPKMSRRRFLPSILSRSGWLNQAQYF